VIISVKVFVVNSDLVPFIYLTPHFYVPETQIFKKNFANPQKSGRKFTYK
jgi:hypothetical protein